MIIRNILLASVLLFIAAPINASQVKDFSFTDLSGNTHTWSAIKGKPIVVNIGSHWWKKCKKEAPELQRAYSTYKNQGVSFLGVFVMSEEKDIRKFAKKYKLTFPVGKNSGVAESLGASTIPETIFINKEGEIHKRYKGTIYFDELKSGIEEIIK